jgi:membrane protease YdiL (CAAX protease family)
MNSYLFKGEFVMIERRNIAVCIVLILVTCGIYGIYWIVCLTNDVNTVSGDVNGTSGGMVVLLTIVTCGIYGIYWAYKQGEKLDFTKNNRGIPSSNSGVLYLILQIFGFGIIAYALMQNELNKLA